MPVQLKKEKFTGKYDGVTSPLLLAPGDISGGKNIRKVSAKGGWKVRKGVTTHNTTAIGSAKVLSLHRYKHPTNNDYHFLAQCDSKIVEASNNPPSNGTTFGTDITNSNTISSTQPGFSDLVGDAWVYADGGRVLTWGGDGSYCIGFLAYDDSADTYSDSTVQVSDLLADTEGLILGGAADELYICSPEIANTITLDLGSAVNSNSVTLTVSSWQSGAWSNRSATDNTASGGVTLAQDGTITWTPSASDTMRVLGGIMGYWYRLTWSGALSNSVSVKSCKTTYNLSILTNKWDGVYAEPLSVLVYVNSAGKYTDITGKITLESTATYYDFDPLTTSDYLFVKSATPLTGVAFGIVDKYENTAACIFDNIDYWDGDSWNTLSTNLIDETLDTTAAKSLTQSGTLWWNAAGLTVNKRTMPSDSLPGYWYRISWSSSWFNTANSEVRVYFMATIAYPESLKTYNGVVEFKGRAMYWGDLREPGRLRYSAKYRPDLIGNDSDSYTDQFGNKDTIVRAIRFYNELMIFKTDSIYLLEGYSRETFGILKITNEVGCCSAKTVQSVEVGYANMHRDEPLTIVIWLDIDGVYILDGRKPKKISEPVDHYFNTEYIDTVISYDDLLTAQSFIDKLRNEYHLIFGDGTELVYNFLFDEWYPPFERSVGGSSDYLVCGLKLRDVNGQFQVYAGNNAGKVFRLEYDTADKDNSNADMAISHSVKTRAISYEQNDTYSFDFIFRGAQIEAKARTTGNVTTTFYKDLSTTGTTLAIPETISLVNASAGLVVDGIDSSEQNCMCYQLEFSVNTIDIELETYSFLYYIDVEGENV